MPSLKDILPGLRAKHGTQVEVAERLGIKSQQLGQYEKGKRNPKIGFYNKWREVFKEDIFAMVNESNDSRETKKHTSVQQMGDNKELSESVYRTIVEGNTEYVLVPR